jgi:hypothetical protein
MPDRSSRIGAAIIGRLLEELLTNLVIVAVEGDLLE